MPLQPFRRRASCGRLRRPDDFADDTARFLDEIERPVLDGVVLRGVRIEIRETRSHRGQTEALDGELSPESTEFLPALPIPEQRNELADEVTDGVGHGLRAPIARARETFGARGLEAA